MSGFMNGKFASLVPYVPGEQPKNVANLIKLNTNESPYPPSPKVMEAITEDEISALRLYSDPTCEALVTAIAEYDGVLPENIYTGNGSDEVLAFCFCAFCENGAAFADITYGFYTVFADMYGVKYREVPLRNDFSIGILDYVNLIETVFIANPNAPTGLALPLSEIEVLLQQDAGRLVVVDEAYVEFGGETAVPLLEKYPNLLITRTFSKSHSLAGGRVGYAIASKELIADLNTLKFSINPYNVNRLSILAGTAAMKDTEYLAETRAKTIEAREYASAALKDMGFKLTDSRANFIFAGENPRISGADYFAKLRENAILTRYFPAHRTAGYVRISVGTMEEMKRFVAVTKEILGGKQDA